MQIRHHLVFEPKDLAALQRGRMLTLSMNGTLIDVSATDGPASEGHLGAKPTEKCPQCGKRFAAGQSMRMHLGRVHGSITRTGEKRKPKRTPKPKPAAKESA